jgi:hypothetical protein
LLPFGFGLLGIVLSREIRFSGGHVTSRGVEFSAIIYCIFITLTLANWLFFILIIGQQSESLFKKRFVIKMLVIEI